MTFPQSANHAVNSIVDAYDRQRQPALRRSICNIPAPRTTSPKTGEPRDDVDRRSWRRMGHSEVSAHLKVRPGCLAGFKRHAGELIRITKETMRVSID